MREEKLVVFKYERNGNVDINQKDRRRGPVMTGTFVTLSIRKRSFGVLWGLGVFGVGVFGCWGG